MKPLSLPKLDQLAWPSLVVVSLLVLGYGGWSVYQVAQAPTTDSLAPVKKEVALPALQLHNIHNRSGAIPTASPTQAGRSDPFSAQ